MEDLELGYNLYGGFNMRFLTSTPRVQHYKDDLWIMRDNLLYQDDNGKVYLVPRNFVTDFYSIPNWCDYLTGDSAGRTPEPCLVHDFGCAYHAVLEVQLTPDELLMYEYLHGHYDEKNDVLLTVCEDVPEEMLKLRPVTKGEINNMLGRMMRDLDVPKRHLIRFGVCFNFNFYWTGKQYTSDKLYKVDNHYKR